MCKGLILNFNNKPKNIIAIPTKCIISTFNNSIKNSSENNDPSTIGMTKNILIIDLKKFNSYASINVFMPRLIESLDYLYFWYNRTQFPYTP